MSNDEGNLKISYFSEKIFYFSEGDLMGEICSLRSSKSYSCIWYRDVMAQAENRGLIKIVSHTKDMPFWWRKFDESVEIISEKLKNMITNPDVWK